MTKKAYFKVSGERLDSASKPQDGTVTIDRACGLFMVRPARRRRIYCLPLARVARMVVDFIIRVELLEKAREKAAKRKAKQGARPRRRRRKQAS